MLVTGAIIELQDDLNIIWKVKPPAQLRRCELRPHRLLSIRSSLGFGFLLLVSLIIDAGLSRAGAYLEAGFSGAKVILRILNSAVAFGNRRRCSSR